MTELLPYDERVEWINSKLSDISHYEVESLIDDDEAIWQIQQNQSHLLFIGTQKGKPVVDIRYRYRPLVDLVFSLSQQTIGQLLAEADSDMVASLADEAPHELEAFECSLTYLVSNDDINPYILADAREDLTPEELAQKAGVDLENFTNPSRESPPEEDEGTAPGEAADLPDSDFVIEPDHEHESGKNETESSEEEREDHSWEEAWAAAHLRVGSVSDSARERLSLKLHEIMSEGPLIYDIQQSNANVVTLTRLAHRIYGLNELTTQEFYEAIQLVKSTGDYGRNYLRYALRISEDIHHKDAEEDQLINDIKL